MSGALFSSESPSKSNPSSSSSCAAMERVQHMTKSAIRRASQIEVNPQTKRNLQELFVNFTLILICLLLIYIIVMDDVSGKADRGSVSSTSGSDPWSIISCIFI
ncbi:cardiac phospholamban [Solea senegalensis]|uniref:Phospholamban n=1 Tax=Solea senegalensis TaxID=28829 RepID=A0AAV6R9X5_SOLSE|nr:cardiac phospholamban [Solea senegalensis]